MKVNEIQLENFPNRIIISWITFYRVKLTVDNWFDDNSPEAGGGKWRIPWRCLHRMPLKIELKSIESPTTNRRLSGKTFIKKTSFWKQRDAMTVHLWCNFFVSVNLYRTSFGTDKGRTDTWTHYAIGSIYATHNAQYDSTECVFLPSRNPNGQSNKYSN